MCEFCPGRLGREPWPARSETSRLESSCQTEEETCQGLRQPPDVCLSTSFRQTYNCCCAAKLLLTKQKSFSTEKCEFSELLEGCGPSANKTLKKRIKSFWGGGAPRKTNVLSAINLNFSVQFIAI